MLDYSATVYVKKLRTIYCRNAKTAITFFIGVTASTSMAHLTNVVKKGKSSPINTFVEWLRTEFSAFLYGAI